MWRPSFVIFGLLTAAHLAASPIDITDTPPLFTNGAQGSYEIDANHFFYGLGAGTGGDAGSGTSSYDADTDVLSSVVTHAVGPIGGDFFGGFNSTLSLLASIDSDGILHGGSFEWFFGDTPDLGIQPGELLLSGTLSDAVFTLGTDFGTPRFEFIADVVFRHALLDVGDLVGLILYHSPSQTLESEEPWFHGHAWESSLAPSEHYLTDGIATVRPIPTPSTSTLLWAGLVAGAFVLRIGGTRASLRHRRT